MTTEKINLENFPGLENYDASNFIDGTAFKSCIANISKIQTLREITTYHKQLIYSADILVLLRYCGSTNHCIDVNKIIYFSSIQKCRKK